MTKPIIFLVASDLSLARRLTADLGRRFGRDFRIVAEHDAGRALEALRALARRSEPVALVMADDRIDRISGEALLARSRPLHPRARLVLVVERDSSRQTTVAAMPRGKVDLRLVKPWHPTLGLYPAVTELIEDWMACREPGEAPRIANGMVSREWPR